MWSLKKNKGRQAETADSPGEVRPCWLIVNPEAGNGRGRKVLRQAEAWLDKRCIPYTVCLTERKGHARELAERILKETNGRAFLFSVGGDGTFHEVANAAAGWPEAVIASLPAGSGNDYIRGFQKTKTTEQALALLESKHFHFIDLGFYKTPEREGMFVNSIGLGLDAEVTAEVNSSRLKRRLNVIRAGKLVYLFVFIKKLTQYKKAEIVLEIDGNIYEYNNVWLVLAANQPFFGGGLRISPRSSSSDGRFEVIVVHSLSPVQLLLMFSTVLWGGHLRFKKVVSHSGREIRIQSREKVCIQADGEIVGSKQAEISVGAGLLAAASHMPGRPMPEGAAVRKHIPF